MVYVRPPYTELMFYLKLFREMKTLVEKIQQRLGEIGINVRSVEIPKAEKDLILRVCNLVLRLPPTEYYCYLLWCSSSLLEHSTLTILFDQSPWTTRNASARSWVG
jgi:hypothetical protein